MIIIVIKIANVRTEAEDLPDGYRTESCLLGDWTSEEFNFAFHFLWSDEFDVTGDDTFTFTFVCDTQSLYKERVNTNSDDGAQIRNQKGNHPEIVPIMERWQVPSVEGRHKSKHSRVSLSLFLTQSYLGIMSAAGFMLAPAFWPMVMVTVATVSPMRREGGEWWGCSRLQATRTIRKVARPWSSPSSAWLPPRPGELAITAGPVFAMEELQLRRRRPAAEKEPRNCPAT